MALLIITDPTIHEKRCRKSVVQHKHSSAHLGSKPLSNDFATSIRASHKSLTLDAISGDKILTAYEANKKRISN